MRLKLVDIPLPLGICRKFLARWDENFLNDLGEEITDFDLEIKYPPLDYDGEIFWNEFSYRKYRDTSLTWVYDEYADGR